MILLKDVTVEGCVGCPMSSSDDDGMFCDALQVFMRFDELPNGRRKDCPIVDLIRCKDCKWYAHCDDCYGDCMYQYESNGFVYVNDYCSWAEPKETS